MGTIVHTQCRLPTVRDRAVRTLVCLSDGGGTIVKGLERRILVLEGDTDTDAEELTALTAQLRWRLLELDVESVESVREGEVPLGAKPIDVVSVGAIVVMLSTAAVPAVVRLMEGWLQRPVLRIKVTIGGD